MARRLIALLGLLLATAAFARPAQAEFVEEIWVDPARGDRATPVRVYLPDGTGAHPVVIFTPGLGQDRSSAAYLGEYWAAHGYVAAFLQHPGTDAALTLEQLRRAGVDPQALSARYRDLPFAISTLLRRAREAGPLLGRVEPSRIAVAGHSLGAVGAAVAIGRKTSAGADLKDVRIGAAILMSPTPGPGGDAVANYRDVSVPVLHLTGLADRDESVPQNVAERFKPFAALKGRPQVLVVFLAGDHLVFSASPSEVRGQPAYRPIQAAVQDVTTRFLDAILRRDEAARSWLLDGGLASMMKGAARIETAR